jgi:chromosome partitioning protein
LTGFKTCPAHLSYLDIYGTATDVGKAPQEIEPKGKAATELQQLYMWICKHFDMSGGKHGDIEQADRLAKGA